MGDLNELFWGVVPSLIPIAMGIWFWKRREIWTLRDESRIYNPPKVWPWKCNDELAESRSIWMPCILFLIGVLGITLSFAKFFGILK